MIVMTSEGEKRTTLNAHTHGQKIKIKIKNDDNNRWMVKWNWMRPMSSFMNI